MNARLPSALAVVSLLAVVASAPACTRRHDACGDASTTSAELVAPIWTAIPQPAPGPPPGRDAPDAAPAPRAPPASPASPASPALASPAPAPEERPLVKIDDAPRPAWVPDAATLTVVEAPDLRRNLGITTDAATTADAAP